jgi:hypothetical protein
MPKREPDSPVWPYGERGPGQARPGVVTVHEYEYEEPNSPDIIRVVRQQQPPAAPVMQRQASSVSGPCARCPFSDASAALPQPGPALNLCTHATSPHPSRQDAAPQVSTINLSNSGAASSSDSHQGVGGRLGSPRQHGAVSEGGGYQQGGGYCHHHQGGTSSGPRGDAADDYSGGRGSNGSGGCSRRVRPALASAEGCRQQADPHAQAAAGSRAAPGLQPVAALRWSRGWPRGSCAAGAPPSQACADLCRRRQPRQQRQARQRLRQRAAGGQRPAGPAPPGGWRPAPCPAPSAYGAAALSWRQRAPAAHLAPHQPPHACSSKLVMLTLGGGKKADCRFLSIVALGMSKLRQASPYLQRGKPLPALDLYPEGRSWRVAQVSTISSTAKVKSIGDLPYAAASASAAASVAPSAAPSAGPSAAPSAAASRRTSERGHTRHHSEAGNGAGTGSRRTTTTGAEPVQGSRSAAASRRTTTGADPRRSLAGGQLRLPGQGGCR